MKIILGCDNIGIDLKNTIVKTLEELGHDVKDDGVFEGDMTAYPEIAVKVAEQIRECKYKRGILICGTGIGMSISANKVKGVYAAVCHDVYSTQRSILSNNVQIMCLGALVIGKATAIALVKQWLDLEFIESPSLEKIKMILDIERKEFFTQL
jgi:ribose 5-phosphate isomerase B